MTMLKTEQKSRKLLNVQILVVIQVTRKIQMVNPNLVCLLNANGVTSRREDFGDGDVANDDIIGTINT